LGGGDRIGPLGATTDPASRPVAKASVGSLQLSSALVVQLVPLVGALAPRNPIAYVVVFGLLSPLALYRGPLNPFGVGIAVYTVLNGLHIIEPLALVAAVMAVVQVQNVCDPTNTANVWVANYTGVHVGEITKLTLPFQVGVAVVACIVAAMFGAELFGKPLFSGSFGPAPAIAATLPGLYAPPAASKTIAFAPHDDAYSVAAAAEIAVPTRAQLGVGIDRLRRSPALRPEADGSECEFLFNKKRHTALATR